MNQAFSVSMCVYGGDHPAHFDTALDSIVNQTVQPSEIVLTVDGPIPETIEVVIEKYRIQLAQSMIDFQVFYLEKNVGHGEARRICFEHCQCELIALMDADDLSVPDRFEKQLAVFAQHPELSIVGGNIHEFIDTPDHCVGKRIVPEEDAAIKVYMQKRCPMNQMTVMFRKVAVQEAGGYQDWYCDEDYYLWIRMALAGKQFANVPENLVNVRVGKEMYQRRGGWKYFKSEAKLQSFMLKKGIISLPQYVVNVAQRLVLQVLMPNKLRGWVFQRFARS